MYQIDNSTAAATQPAPSTPGTPGWFTDGSVGGSIPPTVVPAEWLNAVQAELVNAIIASGQTLSKSSFNQLATALGEKVALSDFTGSNQALAQNGYQIFPGGMILQWGQSTLTSGTVQVTLPLAYPNGCLIAIASEAASNGWGGDVIAYGTRSKSKTGFYIDGRQIAPGGTISSPSGVVADWVSVGY